MHAQLLKLIQIIAVLIHNNSTTGLGSPTTGGLPGAQTSAPGSTTGNPPTPGSTTGNPPPSGSTTGNPPPPGSNTGNPPPAPGNLIQFTPDQSDWTKMNEMTLAVSSVVDHSPDGVKWVTSWPKWDGKIINLKGMSGTQVQNAICEKGIVRGTRELYYEKPFANPKAPTKAEVDDLHIRTINHLRRMVGIDKLVPITFDRCLCSIALWSHQIYATTIWAKNYPNAKRDFCYVFGHCDFVPNPQDQTLTFNGQRNSQICTHQMSLSEGIASTNADLPWSLKFHRLICAYLAEGTTGHAGPLFRREKLCPNFYFDGNGKGVTVRLKAGGNLHSTLPFDS